MVLYMGKGGRYILGNNENIENATNNYEFTRISIRISKKDYWILKKALVENQITMHDAVIKGLNSLLSLNLKTTKE